jgi:tetratricopeptide (TPR) repeat protein
MPRWLLLVLSVYGVAADAAADVVPQRKWLQVRSPHFTVMGEASARDLRNVATHMEQLHAVLGQVARTDAEAGDVTIIVFKTERSYQPFQPRWNGKTTAVAGYFLPGPMNYITILADRDYDYSDVVYHEYVHLAASRSIGELPLWMGEGLADFYSSFEVINAKKVRIGTRHLRYLERLQSEFMPLTTLAAVDRRSPYYNERDKTSIFYAESWALLHFLRIAEKGKYAPRLGPFLDAMLDGMSFDRACNERLGMTTQALESELRQYIGSLFFQHLEVTLPESLGRIEHLDATPVSEGEAHAHLAHLLLAFKAADEAKAHLDHAVAVDPKQPLALARLADLAAAANDRDQAVSLAQRAGDAPSPTYLSAYFRASAIERMNQQSNGDLAAIAAAWRTVVELNPRMAEAHSRFAQAQADTQQELEQAKLAQQQAIALAPAREEYRLGLARILIMLRDTKTARGLLGPLVARGSTRQITATARQYLGIAAQVELAITAGTATPRPERPPDVVTEPVEPTPPATPPADNPNPGPANAAANFEHLVLRHVLDGEIRIFGLMKAIECTSDAARLVIETASGLVRVRGGTLDTMDFVSYRDDIRGGINCGPQALTPPVLVTYRPEPDHGTAGEVIIVEVVPVGYKPPGQ